MIDLIIKSHKDTLEESLKKAKARNAWLINDDEPGTGFSEDADEGVGCVSGQAGTPEHQLSYDDPLVLDAQKRAEDSKPSDALDDAVAELRQSNIDASRNQRLPFQEEYMLSNWTPGTMMHISDFIVKLQKVRPDAFLAEYAYLGLRGLGFIIGGKPEYSGCALQNGMMAEWSQVRTDNHGRVLNDRYRGWRTVLLTLIRKNIITEFQCDNLFGKPTGPRSRPWHRSLYSIRNGVCGECRKTNCDCGASQWYSLRADKYQYEIPQEIANGKRQEFTPRSECRIFVP